MAAISPKNPNPQTYSRVRVRLQDRSAYSACASAWRMRSSTPEAVEWAASSRRRENGALAPGRLTARFRRGGAVRGWVRPSQAAAGHARLVERGRSGVVLP